MRDQIQLLLGLYWQPVRAASRIIDEGRIWFAVCAAVLAIAAMQFGTSDTIRKYVQPSQIEAEQDDELSTPTTSGDPLVAMLGLTLEPTGSCEKIGMQPTQGEACATFFYKLPWWHRL